MESQVNIIEQAHNFWTGKNFDICCDDPNCHYESGLMKDGSYQVISEGHGFRITMQRATEMQLIDATLDWLETEDEFEDCEPLVFEWQIFKDTPGYENVQSRFEPLDKVSTLTRSQISFWNEVAATFQEIPEWLIQPLDEAVDAKIVLDGFGENPCEEEELYAGFTHMDSAQEPWACGDGSYLLNSYEDPVHGIYGESDIKATLNAFDILNKMDWSKAKPLDWILDYQPMIDWNEVQFKHDPDDKIEMEIPDSLGVKLFDHQIETLEELELLDGLIHTHDRACTCEMQMLLSQGCDCGGV
jgi:hypothetical protein